jgi:uncharacterized BrkB/YihY/UPF0761 family membrane protein
VKAIMKSAQADVRHRRASCVFNVSREAISRFTIGRHLFGLYFSHAGTAGAFGAAGSLAVLMMWLYFCAVVFLFGSEVSGTGCGARRAGAVA